MTTEKSAGPATRAATNPPAGTPARPPEASRSGHLNWVTLAAVTLIAIQLVWMAALLAHSYFRQDNYFTFDRALNSGFTWKYLMFVQAGHLSPLILAIAWV